MRSWRTASVALLLSFSSGLPSAWSGTSIPDWMRIIGVDIRVVGLFTLAQAPWAFKVVWSPLMDRYVPPFWGRRRGGWRSRRSRSACSRARAGWRRRPSRRDLGGRRARARRALASATQDVAIDAYAVEVLRDEEQGAAVGARIAAYRAGDGRRRAARPSHWPARLGWPAVNVLLALVYFRCSC